MDAHRERGVSVAFDDPFGTEAAVEEAPRARKLPKEDPAYRCAPAQPGQPVVVTLPPAISANRYWAHRVVTPKGGRAMALTYVTNEARAYRESVGWLVKSAGVRQPLQGRVQLDIEMWPHRPLDWAKRAKADPLYWADTVQRIDADNCIKVVCDSLKDIVFGDDRAVWDVRCRVMEPDGRDACLVVTITPLVKDNPQEVLL